MRLHGFTLVYALTVWLNVSPALAVTYCPPGAGGGPSLAAIDGELRLRFIDTHLSRTATAARLWTYGWGAGLMVAGVGSLVTAPFVPRRDRIDWYVTGGSAFVGVAPLLIEPLAVMADADALHKLINTHRAAANLCWVLSDAEKRLVRDARDQAFWRSPWIHVANIAFNTAIGLLLGFGFHHWLSGILNATLGSAAGEVFIFTQPNGNVQDLERYQRGDLLEPRNLSAPSLSYRALF
jgi:hypothetical protein